MEANNRAMREACKVVIDAIETIYAHEDDAEFVRVWLDQTKKACEEALSAPPRNCDRPECATYGEAIRTLEAECEDCDDPMEWLLAPATEQKGATK